MFESGRLGAEGGDLDHGPIAVPVTSRQTSKASSRAARSWLAVRRWRRLLDIGLTPGYTGEVRFEVFGANTAKSFAAGHGINAHGQQLIWDAVALHTTPSIARFKEAEVACCNAGMTLDISGIRPRNSALRC